MLAAEVQMQTASDVIRSSANNSMDCNLKALNAGGEDHL